ncbi:hypothetical protein N7495_003169 [Penicillium taxi]|uniref:uncharacterized protein n=1 Tax=Penicillium taxi TaxID=168475 RepID=UPI0025452DE9|nr:uncharacterized protein N7495_003169 [Penicillium taxi]KAJ5902641.1 hypothetical protein N7495_003169 [Penicillium taxi]
MTTRLIPKRIPLKSGAGVVKATSCRSSHAAAYTRPPLAYTWLTKSPEAITHQDVLSSLNQTSTDSLNQSSFPLLLVTPRLAHWLDPSSPFLSDLLAELYRNHPGPRTVYAAAAVVDKIPGATTESPVSDALEYEGLSLLVVQDAGVQWKATPPRRIGQSAGEEPSLTVSIHNEVTGQTPHEIGLRLAQTVFLNGKERTFLGMRWTADANSTYRLDKSLDLAACAVSSTGKNIRAGLTLPLDVVTPRRRVLASMGNIIRQVAKSTDLSSTEAMPASTELEKELPRYITEHKITDRRVSIWALVEKPKIELVDGSSHDRLIHSLKQGGKLHRVMSGGGGWGKKLGLLSLDPEASFPDFMGDDVPATLDKVFESDATYVEKTVAFENLMIGDDLSHLSQIATVGDLIQFFVAVEPVPSSEEPVLMKEATFTFGIVADAEKAVVEDLGQDKHLVTVEDAFGALSEKAITYSQPLQLEGAVKSTTKLDIPGCRVILTSEK